MTMQLHVSLFDANATLAGGKGCYKRTNASKSLLGKTKHHSLLRKRCLIESRLKRRN